MKKTEKKIIYQMWTVNEIEEKLFVIQQSIAAGVDFSNGYLIQEKLNEQTQNLAITSELFTQAEYHYNKKAGGVAKANPEISPTQLKAITLSECADEKRVMTLAERLNAAVTHTLESLRSQLSYHKSQLANLPGPR